MSVYMNDNVNDSFRKEPDAEKPHVRICEGRTTVGGASTRPNMVTACWYSCLKRRQLYYEYRKNSCNTAMAGSGSAPPLSTDFAALTYLKIKAKLLLFLYMNSAIIFVLRLIALLSSDLIRIRQ